MKFVDKAEIEGLEFLFRKDQDRDTWCRVWWYDLRPALNPNPVSAWTGKPTSSTAAHSLISLILAASE